MVRFLALELDNKNKFVELILHAVYIFSWIIFFLMLKKHIPTVFESVSLEIGRYHILATMSTFAIADTPILPILPVFNWTGSELSNKP